MEKTNQFYKSSYTGQEVQECFDWYSRNMEQLPKSFNLNKTLFFPDVKHTIQQMMNHLETRVKDSRVFSGQFAVLLQLRQAFLEQEGFHEL